MKVKKTAILGIDLQNDFTTSSGALFVNGADSDVIRIASFIDRYASQIDYIGLTLDSHQPIHISNQCYWQDWEGYPPRLYSVITAEDVSDGKWRPLYNVELALDYLISLQKKGQICTIWPSHCIIGSHGWALDTTLMGALTMWCVSNAKTYELFYKGEHQATEHYSALKAAVEYQDSPETGLNRKLLSKLENFDRIILVGEAADYCVANSLDDILKYSPQLSDKIVILTDCMSWIEQNNQRAQVIFDKARERGVKFLTTDDYEH